MYVGGRWVETGPRATTTIMNPATADARAEVARATQNEVEQAVAAARAAFDDEDGPWRSLGPAERASLLRRAADLLEPHVEDLAVLETENNGKPLRESRSQAAEAVRTFRLYARLADALAGPTELLSPAGAPPQYVVREPAGVIAAIAPWNFPVATAANRIATALAAGCTIIYKPAELTPLTALELVRILEPLELPPGVVNVVTGPGSVVGEALAASPHVDGIIFTGGTEAGKRVMALAAGTMKRVTMELGGKNPAVVFADADVETALRATLRGGFANQGESCSAISRILVEQPLYDRFVSEFAARASRIRVGDGLDPATEMGPLVSAAHREKVEGYIRVGLSEGARLVTGGERPDLDDRYVDGYFLQPTVFADVTPGATIAREEIFGPVVSILGFEEEEAAVQLANDSDYGLLAAVFTADPTRGARVLTRIRVGIGYVNSYGTARADAPWGGFKQSGIGRVRGRWGLDACLEDRQVNIGLG